MPLRHGRLEGLDRIAVVHPLEGRVDERLEPLDAVLVDVLGEERHVVGPLVEHGAEQILEEVLGQVGVVVQVGEGDFRLDHPELGEVAGRVRILGAEGRPERVHPVERQAVRLDVELPGDGQARRLAEEVGLAKSMCPCSSRGRLARSSVETRNIAPAPSASLVVMIGVCTQMKPRSWKYRWTAIDRQCAHPRHRAERVGARPQVGHGPQVLHRVPLGRDRIAVRVLDPADHLDAVGLDLEPLALALRLRPACRSARSEQCVVRCRISF